MGDEGNRWSSSCRQLATSATKDDSQEELSEVRTRMEMQSPCVKSGNQSLTSKLDATGVDQGNPRLAASCRGSSRLKAGNAVRRLTGVENRLR